MKNKTKYLTTIYILLVAVFAMKFPAHADEILFVKRVLPQCPKQNLNEISNASVKASFTITKTGLTKDIQIASSTDKFLNNYVIEAIKKYEYKPFQSQGKAVAVNNVVATVEFTHCSESNN